MPVTPEQGLAIIKRIESGGGKNYNHATIDRGVDKGKKAIGDYGLTPSTVNAEILKRHPNLYPLTKLHWTDQKAWLEAHPAVQHEIAAPLWNELLQRYGTPEKAAYSWNHGTSLHPHQINDSVMKYDDYVGNFNKLKSKFTDNQGANNTSPQEQMSSAPMSQLDSDIRAHTQAVIDKNNPRVENTQQNLNSFFTPSYFQNIKNKINGDSEEQTQNTPLPIEEIPTLALNDEEDNEEDT